jgi:MYXO-CTERM domain-containing protein
LYDDIKYSSVPEPGSIGLGLLGLAGLGAVSFLRRSSAKR